MCMYVGDVIRGLAVTNHSHRILCECSICTYTYRSINTCAHRQALSGGFAVTLCPYTYGTTLILTEQYIHRHCQEGSQSPTIRTATSAPLWRVPTGLCVSVCVCVSVCQCLCLCLCIRSLALSLARARARSFCACARVCVYPVGTNVCARVHFCAIVMIIIEWNNNFTYYDNDLIC